MSRQEALNQREEAKKELYYILKNEPENKEAKNLLHTLNKK